MGRINKLSDRRHLGLWDRPAEVRGGEPSLGPIHHRPVVRAPEPPIGQYLEQVPQYHDEAAMHGRCGGPTGRAGLVSGPQDLEPGGAVLEQDGDEAGVGVGGHAHGSVRVRTRRVGVQPDSRRQPVLGEEVLALHVAVADAQ